MSEHDLQTVKIDTNGGEDEASAEASGCFGKKKKKKEAVEFPDVPLTRILFLDPSSGWLIVVGSFAAMVSGAMLPAFSVVFGELFNDIAQIETGDFDVNPMVLAFVGLAVASFIFTFMMTTAWVLVGEKTTKVLKEKYFRSLLRQEIGYFDKHGTGGIVSRISSDMALVQGGISEKLGQIFFFGAQVFGGLIIAFIYGWKLTLVLLASSPLIILSGALQTQAITRNSQSGTQASGGATETATEAIAGIRTVYSFTLEPLLMNRFTSGLEDAYKINFRKSFIMGAGGGFSFLFMFLVYALAFWYGTQLVESGEMELGDLLTVFFSIVIGAMGIGQAGQLSPDLAKAKGAAAAIFFIIDRKSEIYAGSGGKKLDKLKGEVRFENVGFCYPTRPENTVLKDFSIVAKPGTTTALVGASGSGKSTVVQLIERFYDPTKGKVLIDGKNVRKLDLRWLRKNIGLVAQEPILFAGTIRQNIEYGKPGASFDEIKEAAKSANAHDFITAQTNGYDTSVGEKGAQLSGGQKQRIAIARAVLKNPKILLLDEATSALDAESEHLVQDALDKLMAKRTSVVIAHRLTTIRNADKICVLNKGKLVEQGTHAELLDKNGFYANLVARQMHEADDSSSEEEKHKKSKKTDKKNGKKSKKRRDTEQMDI